MIESNEIAQNVFNELHDLGYSFILSPTSEDNSFTFNQTGPICSYWFVKSEKNEIELYVKDSKRTRNSYINLIEDITQLSTSKIVDFVIEDLILRNNAFEDLRKNRIKKVDLVVQGDYINGDKIEIINQIINSQVQGITVGTNINSSNSNYSQGEHFLKQNIDNRFFQLFNLFQNVLNEKDGKGIPYKEKIKENIEQILRDGFKGWTDRPPSSLDFFKKKYLKIKKEFILYFNTFFNLINFVDNSESNYLNEKEKNDYIKTLKAHLSNIEVRLLVYYLIFDDDKTYSDLINKYSLIENFSLEDKDKYFFKTHNIELDSTD
ncbi:MAG: putative phage abortive infection protein [Cyanobacteriota bacterium]